MIVLLTNADTPMHIRRAGPLRLLLARLRQCELDRQLAAGSTPESSMALAAHAEWITRRAQREQLAHHVRHVLSAAASAPARRRVPVCRDRIQRAETEMTALADRLLSVEAISPRGVAMTRRLLADGSGPLFQPRSRTQLRDQVCAALTALRVDLAG